MSDERSLFEQIEDYAAERRLMDPILKDFRELETELRTTKAALAAANAKVERLDDRLRAVEGLPRKWRERKAVYALGYDKEECAAELQAKLREAE